MQTGRLHRYNTIAGETAAAAQLESEYAEYMGQRFCLACTSGGYAMHVALKAAGLKQDALDWIELNEAFAAQSLAVMNTLGLDPAKVNPMGGAIALGHPLGATGAIRSATVVHALQRHQLKYGMVTMCVGMGQGAAGIFERV